MPISFALLFESFEVSPESEVTASGAAKVRIKKTVMKFEGAWPSELAGLAVRNLKDHGKTEAFEVKFPILASASGAAATTTTQAPPPATADKSLWRMLLYAFIGGLILNVMPCVLPVISLKILGFVNQSKESPARVRLLGMLYGAGVVVSFLVLAGVVIGVKSAGELASWGMQMSNPQFVVLLTVLIMLVALNLFGLFEVTLGSVGAAAGSVGDAGGRGWRVFQRCAGDGFGDALHGAVPRAGAWLCLHANRRRDRADVCHRRAWPRVSVCRAELESEAAAFPAQAGAVDGEIQSGDGLPDAGYGRVAIQREHRILRRPGFVVRHFSDRDRHGCLGVRRVFSAWNSGGAVWPWASPGR